MAGFAGLRNDRLQRNSWICGHRAWFAPRVDDKNELAFPVVLPHKMWYLPVVRTQEAVVAEAKLDLLQGTLDLMVLQTLAAMGSLHGYGIARRIEQVSGDRVLLNQGTIYAALVRLQQRGWISAEWGTSANNRKAKFYSITKKGRKRLSEDAEYWQRLSSVVGRVLAMEEGGEQ